MTEDGVVDEEEEMRPAKGPEALRDEGREGVKLTQKTIDG